jgi:hypothetical protein
VPAKSGAICTVSTRAAPAMRWRTQAVQLGGPSGIPARLTTTLDA